MEENGNKKKRTKLDVTGMSRTRVAVETAGDAKTLVSIVGAHLGVEQAIREGDLKRIVRECLRDVHRRELFDFVYVEFGRGPSRRVSVGCWWCGADGGSCGGWAERQRGTRGGGGCHDGYKKGGGER